MIKKVDITTHMHTGHVIISVLYNVANNFAICMSGQASDQKHSRSSSINVNRSLNPKDTSFKLNKLLIIVFHC